jgi:myosin heavy subunit
MENSQPKTRKSSNQLVLILLIVSLVVAVFVLFFLMQNNLNTQKSQYEKLLAEQKTGYEKDLKKLQEDLQEQIAKARQLGENKQSLVDSLENTIKKVQGDREALRRTTQLSQDQVKKYKDKIEAYEMLLQAKDKEIDRLKSTAETLYKENSNLKDIKNQLITENIEEKTKREQLQTKVDEAAIIKAENVQVNAVDRRGKESSGGQYRASRIEKLNISFSVADNKIAKIGNKDIYLRVIEPTGAVLVNPNTGGEIKLPNQTLNYSARQQILFDNSRQRINFVFARTGEYQSGRHNVEFYCDGQRIGGGSFDIR